MQKCNNSFGDNHLYYQSHGDVTDKTDESRNQRIQELKKKAKMYDLQSNLDLLGVNKNQYTSSIDGKIKDIKKYNNELYKYYDYNNPFLNQGGQIVISTKAMNNLERSV